MIGRALDHCRSKEWDSIRFNYISKRQGAQVTSQPNNPKGDKLGSFTSNWNKKMDNERRVLVLQDTIRFIR